ncbi:MAG: homoprotocatechuate degradation operon regulator HpaR [Pseudomonadota bacterium]
MPASDTADPPARRKSDGYRSTSRALPIALLRAREAVMARFRPVLAGHAVTEQQWRVLRVLAESGPLDATEIAGHCCILMPSLTRIVRTLAAEGLITRSRDTGDGRRHLLTITDAGLALLDRVAPESRAVYEDLEKRYGTERLGMLLDMLEELADLGGRTDAQDPGRSGQSGRSD